MPYFDPVKNFAKVIVNGGYNSTATTITLMSGEGNKLPDPSTDGAFNLVWWNATDYSDPSDDPYREIVRVTAKSGDVLTITRGQENTTSQNHNISGKTYKMMLAFTEKTYTDLQKLVVFQDGTFVGQRPVLDFLNPFSVTDDSANNKLVIYPPLRFGGDGSDGDLIITSGTTTIDLGGAKIFVKNYRNLEISGTGQLTFTNPSNNGVIVWLRVKSDCKITSSVTAINLDGLGSLGGGSAQNSFSPVSLLYPLGYSFSDGEVYLPRWWVALRGYYSGETPPTNNPPSSEAFFLMSTFRSYYGLMPNLLICAGMGGGGGYSGYNPPTNAGPGGRGGGALILEIGGKLTFTSTISANGLNGGNGAPGTTTGGGGGGSGGGVFIIYNDLVANTGTINVNGGNGGNGGGGTGTGLFGGGSGGHYISARAGQNSITGGLAGSSGSGGGSTYGGGGGAGGERLVVKNRWFL